MYKRDGIVWFDTGDKCVHPDVGICIVVGADIEDGTFSEGCLVHVPDVVGKEGFLHRGYRHIVFNRFGEVVGYRTGYKEYYWCSNNKLKYLGGDYEGVDSL